MISISDVTLISILLFGSTLFGCMMMVEIFFGRKKVAQLKQSLELLYVEEEATPKGTFGKLAHWFNRSEYGRELEDELRSANMKLTPFRWMLVYLSGWVVFSFLIQKVLNLGFPYNFLIGYLVIKIGTKKLFSSRKFKLALEVNKQLPEVCRLLASSVKAGLSIQQGIELIASEIKPPAGRLFHFAARELKMGTAMDVTLSKMNERVTSKDLKLMNNTILIQRKVGGNLGQVLEHLARTLEERERVNQEIKNASAESRFIAIILTFMPVFIITMFNFVIDGFAMLMFTIPGLIIMSFSIVLIITGLVIIRKIVNVKV